MIAVDVQVAEGVDEFADLKIAHVCDEMREQRIARDVEGHSEKGICTSLIKLTMKHATLVNARVSAHDLKLEQRMAWRKGHLVAHARVPAGYDQTARIRIGFNL